jgi:hypothetical protein
LASVTDHECSFLRYLYKYTHREYPYRFFVEEAARRTSNSHFAET